MGECASPNTIHVKNGATYFLNGWQTAFPIPYPGDEVFLRIICAGNPSIDRLVDLCVNDMQQLQENILHLGDRILHELDLDDTYLTPRKEFEDSDLAFPKPSCAWLLVKEAFCQLAENDIQIEKSLLEERRQWLLGDFQITGNYHSYRMTLSARSWHQPEIA